MENLRPPKGAIKSKKRVGRGNGSTIGGTSGRGSNGQNARSGGGVRPGFEGGQMPLYRRIARRGFSNYPFKKEYELIYLSKLDEKYTAGETVNFDTLKEKGILSGKKKLVKILSNGEITKKLKISVDKISASAKEKLIAAGCEIMDEEGSNG
ncbi:MAG: 50S ribosomal protein L15 [Spirochaetales bacterium]|nr:50S ribosomal protein L15 [Spirochaetales bacterium]